MARRASLPDDPVEIGLEPIVYEMGIEMKRGRHRRRSADGPPLGAIEADAIRAGDQPLSKWVAALTPWRVDHEHDWSTQTIAGLVRRWCECGVVQIDAADEELELGDFAARLAARRSRYVVSAETVLLLETGEALG